MSKRDSSPVRPSGDDVRVTVELSGSYTDVVDRLDDGGTGDDAVRTAVRPVVADLVTVVDAVERTGGGIRSVVAEEADLDASEWYVRNLLEVLRTYDVVSLDGNTWVPGSAVTADEARDRP